MINSESMIITFEVISCIFMIIILCGSIFGNTTGDKTSVFYRCCLITTIIGAALDAVSYVIEGIVRNATVLVVINMVTYITWVLIVMFFAWYTVSVVGKKVAVPKWVILPVVIITVCCIIACVKGSFNGRLLYIEEGHFIEGPWGNRLSLVLCACMVYMYGVLFFYRKALEKSTFAVIAAFLLFPFVDTILSIYLDIDYTYPILAVGFMVIYVIIQERAVTEDSIRKKLFEENSYIDPLTRAKNLRAYDDVIKSDVHGKAKGIVHFGLNSGEEDILRSFSGVLKTVFEEADIFRISEKEIDVFVYRTSKASLEKRISSVKDALDEEGIDASVKLEEKWDQ
ncbi:MAG: hypothetical protein K6A69_08395 [Lachnospiraceae bacterium]|nr:hypothetical protein [Lachnospiraceae bacterium]